MRAYSFVTVDVFTDRMFGGNPLAVFTDASGLSDEQMQALATELRLSETTFVLPAGDEANTAHVRIFNPAAEMAFAGHPNVGTAFVLAAERPDLGDVLRFEEGAGLVEVTLERDGSGAVRSATVAAPLPLWLGPKVSAEAAAACAGLSPSDVLLARHEPQLASVGHRFMLVEVTGEALARAAPDVGAFRRVVAEEPELRGDMSLHLYVRDGPDIRARMFAPLSATWEDPATGSANAALAAFLLSLEGGEGLQLRVSQGAEMGRPSLLHAEAWRGADGWRASIGGSCVKVMTGEVTL